MENNLFGEAFRPRFYLSEMTDPWMNLSFEEFLFENMDDKDLIVLLYSDSDSVIIGRHQNPWIECPVDRLSERKIGLARRISGGGTVYHDEGNLNFSFMMPRDSFHKERNIEFVLRALKTVGIEGSRTERGDITVEGKKVSGNAQCFRRERSLHHGTLLVDSDLEKLEEAITGTGDDVRTHAVASVRNRVANLGDFAPGLTVNSVAEALRQQFVAEFGAISPVKIRALPDQAREYYTKNLSWDWLYGKSPTFRASLPVGRDGEEGTLSVSVEDGRVTEGRFTAPSRTMELTETLRGMRFDRTQLLEHGLAAGRESAGKSS